MLESLIIPTFPPKSFPNQYFLEGRSLEVVGSFTFLKGRAVLSVLARGESHCGSWWLPSCTPAALLEQQKVGRVNVQSLASSLLVPWGCREHPRMQGGSLCMPACREGSGLRPGWCDSSSPQLFPFRLWSSAPWLQQYLLWPLTSTAAKRRRVTWELEAKPFGLQAPLSSV